MVKTNIPALPETAPFNPGQRAWLNGFFAGLVNLDRESKGNVMLAEVSPPAVAQQPAEESFPWHDPAIAMPERLELAREKPLERRMMAAMAQLDCGACGYVCQSYGEAIARGEEKNLTLCSPGGKDTAAKLKELVQLRVNVGPVSASAKPQAPASTGQAKFDRAHPFEARLICATPLNRMGSDKDTRHVVLELKDSGLSYKPGDALGVWPENCPDLVDEIVERLRASGAEDVRTPDGQPTSLYEALARDYTLTHPTEELFGLLGLEPVENVSLVDVLRQHGQGGGTPIDPAAFVAALSPLQPRLYSISSSLLAHPGQVHLTVGVVRYQSGRGTACTGTCSTYLAERVRPGQRVRIFTHAGAKFGLPEDPDAPIIMVGPGTGIAPFRAFLAHRKAQGAKGPNWLFFGDQRQAVDFLYESELNAHRADGTLSRLSLAFSRDQKHKVYVQTRMLEEARELWRWLEQGAHFYVCGDARRMAADVDAALKQVVREQGGMSDEEAVAYVGRMVKENRYQRDVY
ncbi:MAG TPA: sulfite reductase subunit alpha [Tepidisphaeraceae bacterium]